MKRHTTLVVPQKTMTWKQSNYTSFKPGNTDSNYGYCTYKVENETYTAIKSYRKQRFKWLTTYTGQNHINSTFAKGKYEEYEYHLGWYSNIFIGNLRHNLAFRSAYIDITYNPTVDKGKGNIVWFQYLQNPPQS